MSIVNFVVVVDNLFPRCLTLQPTGSPIILQIISMLAIYYRCLSTILIFMRLYLLYCTLLYLPFQYHTL